MGRLRKIVITGGPGGGKTAALELVRRHYWENVVVLQESASLLYAGGFPRDSSAITARGAQRAIYYVQRELERIAEEHDGDNVILCDRGTLDGLAYWPDAPEGWFRDLQTSMSAEYARYDAVIHLRVPSPHNGYNHSNPLRIESPHEARSIDERIAAIWSGHPHRVFVDSTEDFIAKATRVVALIGAELPQPERGAWRVLLARVRACAHCC